MWIWLRESIVLCTMLTCLSLSSLELESRLEEDDWLDTSFLEDPELEFGLDEDRDSQVDNPAPEPLFWCWWVVDLGPAGS